MGSKRWSHSKVWRIVNPSSLYIHARNNYCSNESQRKVIMCRNKLLSHFLLSLFDSQSFFQYHKILISATELNAIYAVSTKPLCVWHTIFRNSQLAEWIGHPQIPCIVKLPHALLVPTVQMYTLKIAGQNQTARPTLRHEIRTSSSFGLHMNIHATLRSASLAAVACVPIWTLMSCFERPSTVMETKHLL